MKKIIPFILLAAAMSASAGSPLDALGGVLTSITSTSKFQLSQIEGTWSYQAPAVSFKSDKALNKIGGVAASAAVEQKLAPYYTQLGLTSMTLEVAPVDSAYNFSMKLRGATLKGTITKNDDAGELTFHCAAFGKINLGSLSAKAQKSATGVLSLTFDAARFVSVVTKVASLTNLSSAKAISSLLNSYDGIYIGAKLKQTSKSATSVTSSSTPASADSVGAGSKAAKAIYDAIKSRKGKK